VEISVVYFLIKEEFENKLQLGVNGIVGKFVVVEGGRGLTFLVLN
jgi:hypothetical protein